jgi:hypothetical protein
MSFGSSKVNQPSLAEENDSPAIGKCVLIDVRTKGSL